MGGSGSRVFINSTGEKNVDTILNDASFKNLTLDVS